MENDAARQMADATTKDDNLPPDPPPPEDDAPVGWKRLIPGEKWRLFRLSLDHPSYPQTWLANHRQKERHRLERSGAAAAAVEYFRWIWDVVGPKMRAAPTFAEWFELRKLLGFALEETASLIPFGDRFTRRAYLAEQVLPDYLFPLAGDPDSGPVEMIVNNDTIPIPVELQPGEIMIRLADLPPTPLVENFKAFITEAQREIFGYEDRRGRPTNIENARQIADMKARGEGFARDIINAIDGQPVSANAARKKVKRALNTVEAFNAARATDAARAAQAAWEQSPHRREDTK